MCARDDRSVSVGDISVLFDEIETFRGFDFDKLWPAGVFAVCLSALLLEVDVMDFKTW